MKEIITQIKRYTKDKDGKPLKTKNGKPYERINLQIQSYGDKWISGFGNQRNAGWQAGDQVELEIKQNGDYLNFEMPRTTPAGGMSEADRQMLQDIKVGVNMLQENMKHVLAILSKPDEEPEMPDFE